MSKFAKNIDSKHVSKPFLGLKMIQNKIRKKFQIWHGLFAFFPYKKKIDITFCLKITSIAPRNLSLVFNSVYVFLWRYGRYDIVYTCRYDNQEFKKKFWSTFVEKMLRNKCVCENWVFFLRIFELIPKGSILDMKKVF